MKCNVLIVSSDQSLTLAERLQEALRTVCEATVWSEQDRHQAGETAIEALEGAMEDFDFAAILLVQNDLASGADADRRSRDNCIFEAGYFTAINGHVRCMLVHGSRQEDLPANLGHLESIRFDEPEDLTDPGACARAVAPIADVLRKRVEKMGQSAFHSRIPLLATVELLQRERPLECGGVLQSGGKVVVCDTQPMADIEVALQVSRNIESGTSYHYFLYLTADCIDKTCQSIQVILVGLVGRGDIAPDFNSRVGSIKEKREQVLDILQRMCASRELRVTFLIDEPQFRFRVHNASDPTSACVYARYLEHGFVPWAEGRSAMALWAGLPKWLADDEATHIFIPLKGFELEGERWNAFERQLDKAMSRYFPGMESDVKQMLTSSSSSSP